MKGIPMLKKIVVAAVMATTLSSSLSAIAAPSVQVGFSPEGTARNWCSAPSIMPVSPSV